MRTRARWLLLVAVVALAGAGLRVLAQQQARFPHDLHARLFPSCLGCHEGVPTGSLGTSFPAPALCVRCHDGTAQRRVAWSGATPTLSNLKFSHPVHQARQALECAACHTTPAAERMDVRRTIVGQCLSCHTPQASDHYTDTNCTICHVPMAASAFPALRVAAVPVPPDHARDDFLSVAHGQLATSAPLRCATCHTRELCASCHVNIATLRAAASIPEAQPLLAVPAFRPRYFEPASHSEAAWLEQHGRAARNIA